MQFYCPLCGKKLKMMPIIRAGQQDTAIDYECRCGHKFTYTIDPGLVQSIIAESLLRGFTRVWVHHKT